MEQWWKERVVYQIYPRSFQDAGSSGFGNIPGIIMRLDELKALGVGIIWLSPVYKSPDADNGYDISDYYTIDPKYGTMEDMEQLIAEADYRDIKIVMDMVMNHTSDEHEWFRQSRNKESPYRDYYIWRPPTAEGKPPNNWTSFFMGSAWKFDPKSGEYYLHLFHEKQPDLNFRNPKVIKEFKDIMHFWLHKGVSGFRLDVINVIYKSSLNDGSFSVALRGKEHYTTQEGAHKILQEFRRDVWSKYDCFTVGEAPLINLHDAKLLCDPVRRELDMLFYFDHLSVDRVIVKYIPKKFSAKKLLDVMTKWQQGLKWNAVYLENHDQPRIVSHFGDDKQYWERSAKLLAVLLLTQKGTPFIYQGQEIGMTNFDYHSISSVNDIETININNLMRRWIPARTRWRWLKECSRDNARTPMQWSAEPAAGFTKGKPWLRINNNYTKINYEEQKTRKDSILSFYKMMIALRAASETLKYGDFDPVYADRQVLSYTRTLQKDEQLTVILNMSGEPADTRILNELIGKVVVSNTGRTDFDGHLDPWEAVVLKVW